MRGQAGNALPTVLSLLTLAAFGYVAFTIAAHVLRHVVGAL